jgi:hypothetical protein
MRFKFFPTFSELAGFLSERASLLQQAYSRAKTIAEATPSLPLASSGKPRDDVNESTKANDFREVHNLRVDKNQSKFGRDARSLRDKAQPRTIEAKALVAAGLSNTSQIDESAAEQVQGRVAR